MNETAQEVKRWGKHSCRRPWTRPGPGEAPGRPRTHLGPASPAGGCLPVQVPLRSPSLRPLHFLRPGLTCCLRDFFVFCKIASYLFFTFTFLIHLESVWLHLSGVQFSPPPDGRSLVPTPLISQPALFPPSRSTTLSYITSSCTRESIFGFSVVFHCLFLCQSHIDLITVTLYYVLISGKAKTPCYSFFSFPQLLQGIHSAT